MPYCLKYLGFLLLALLPLGSKAEDVLAAVASNFTAAIKDMVVVFEQNSGHRVTLAFGSSGKFYAQIKNGAPFQVFFSADQAKPMALEHEGLAVQGSRFTYAIGTLALWSAKPNGVDPLAEVLKQGRFNKLAIANPKLAPYGMAAMDVLQNLGIEQKVRHRLVQGENIAQTYQFVATGNADLGLVALSQIIVAKGGITHGSAWKVPDKLYRPIRQDAVLLHAGERSAAAREFLQFVRGAKAKAVIESYGYRTEAGS